MLDLWKFIDDDDEKVRDDCHVTGKIKDEAHKSCKKNLQLTKKAPVIFHNLRGYDSYLIFYDFNKFNVKIKVIPNRLENAMIFFKQTLSLYCQYAIYQF